MQKLTRQQSERLNYIKKFWVNNNRAPTIYELTEAWGVSSLNTTCQTVLHLRSKGHLVDDKEIRPHGFGKTISFDHDPLEDGQRNKGCKHCLYFQVNLEDGEQCTHKNNIKVEHFYLEDLKSFKLSPMEKNADRDCDWFSLNDTTSGSEVKNDK